MENTDIDFASGEVNLSHKQIAILQKIGYTNKQILEEHKTNRTSLLRQIGTYCKERDAGKIIDNRLVVCFTGFDNQEKLALKQLADSAGFRVASSVTLTCNILVCGMNAGPKKILMANSLNIPKIDGNSFREFVKGNQV